MPPTNTMKPSKLFSTRAQSISSILFPPIPAREPSLQLRVFYPSMPNIWKLTRSLIWFANLLQRRVARTLDCFLNIFLASHGKECNGLTDRSTVISNSTRAPSSMPSLYFKDIHHWPKRWYRMLKKMPIAVLIFFMKKMGDMAESRITLPWSVNFSPLCIK